VLAATNRDVPQMVKEGKFREDLYYRLNVITVLLPGLKDREGDIPLLIDHFLTRAAQKKGGKKKLVSQDAMRALQQYSWPGNVRELQNEVERMLILSGSDEELGMELLSDRIRAHVSPPVVSSKSGRETLKEAVEGVERSMIEGALLRNRWNRSKTARDLGVSRSNLLQKIQAFGLVPPPEMADEQNE